MSEYHAIVSLAERDVKTCLLMQRPQGSDNIYPIPGRTKRKDDDDTENTSCGTRQ